ncbi:MAG: hypothetical protein IKZ96_01690 [Bacilli bacterium]|nr:hypothetical protein [Bacilli bacterium]
MKKGIFVGALVTLLCIPSYAYAKGAGSIRFEGNQNVNVGDEFKVNMVIDNVSKAEGGIVAFGGYISYDKDLLEIVDAKSANEYFDVVRNKNIDKIIGLDYSLENGIYNRSNVYEITFRTINEGNTTITLRDGELVDKTAEELDVTTNGLNVTINPVVNAVEEVKEEVKPVNVVYKEEKTQTPESVIEENIEIKEEKEVVKTVKTTKKVAKKATKTEKNLLKKVSKFFKKLFKKVA